MGSFKLLLIMLLLTLSACLSNLGGGMSQRDPLLMKDELDPQSLAILNQAYQLGSPVVDHHLHMVGNNTPVSAVMEEICPSLLSVEDEFLDQRDAAAWIHPDRLSALPGLLPWIKTQALMSTMKIASIDSADVDSLKRLLALVQSLTLATSNSPGFELRIHMLAVDGHYQKGASNFDTEKTDMLIPSAYVLQVSRCLNSQVANSDPFVPVMSINPYRADALEELARFKDHMRYMKWVAPAMGFDPMDPYIDPFYKKMREYGIVLLSHTGGEHAFEVRDESFRQYGDPLVHRRALDFGIPVILSHAGGDDDDKVEGRYINREHFLELVEDEKNQRQWCLFGDTSALLLTKNLSHFEKVLELAEAGYPYRILYGSDYPLPAVGFNFPLNALIDEGYIDSADRNTLKTLFEYNPLAFDVVTRHLLTVASEAGEKRSLPTTMFMSLEENILRERSDSTLPPRQRRERCQQWYDQHVSTSGS